MTEIRAALIADVVDSTKLSASGRQLLDEKLRELFATLNHRHAADLTGDYGFSVGDEFQAVFRSGDSAIRSMLLVHSRLASRTPFRVRTSIGIGPLFVTHSRAAREQDGPAFHVARKQIVLIHKKKQRLQIACAGTGPLVSACNQTFTIGCRLIDAIWSGWTVPQWEAALQRWEGKNSREAAESLHIRPQNVSKRLQSARFRAVDETMKDFARMLQGPGSSAPSQPTEGRTASGKITLQRVITSGSPLKG